MPSPMPDTDVEARAIGGAATPRGGVEDLRICRLARLRSARASYARMVHRPPTMDSVMMGFAVVKVSQMVRSGKSIG